MKSGRYLDSVRSALPEEAQTLLDQAFAGDALAARRLMVLAPRRLRGHIAFLAFQSKVENPAYREMVKAVWAKDARALLVEFWRPQIVRRMLARAEFRIPHFSGPISVFRALRRGAAKKAAAELCWSLSPEAALSEAGRVGETRPRLLRATIEPADIVYWRNGHGEPEIVSRHPVRGVSLSEPGAPRRDRSRAPAPMSARAGYSRGSHHG